MEKSLGKRKNNYEHNYMRNFDHF